MGDSLRGVIFGHWVRKQFPPHHFPRVADIAGGTGILSSELKYFGYHCTVFDVKRGKDKGYQRVEADVENLKFEPKAFDLVLGLHPDQATFHIIRLAKEAGVPFAIVPCCVMPPTEYQHLTFTEREWECWLIRQAHQAGFATFLARLQMRGKNLAIKGWLPTKEKTI